MHTQQHYVKFSSRFLNDQKKKYRKLTVQCTKKIEYLAPPYRVGETYLNQAAKKLFFVKNLAMLFHLYIIINFLDNRYPLPIHFTHFLLL